MTALGLLDLVHLADDLADRVEHHASAPCRRSGGCAPRASPVTMNCSGMPSGSGVVGRLPGLGPVVACSMRHGLPVNERRAHRVAAGGVEVAAASAPAATSASSTVSHSEPVHTPWAPRASAAAICRPVPMPPAASIGVGATASMTSGHSTIEPISPVWPPPSVPWAMTMSTPASLCVSACYGDAAQRGDQATGVVDRVDHLGRRRAERVGDEAHLRVLEGDLRPAASRWPRSSRAARHRVLVLGQLGHAVVGEELLGEVAVLLGHHVAQRLGQLLRVHLAHALVLAGDDDVDAVGLVADVLVDPLELDLELLGR